MKYDTHSLTAVDPEAPITDLTARPAPTNGAALIALAARDPASAATWLIEHQPATVRGLSRSHLTRILAWLAESITENPGLVPQPRIRDLLRDYGHLLASETVRDLAFAARTAVVDPDLRKTLESALQRAPDSAGLLRAAAELAVASKDHVGAHDLLTRLARSDSSLASVQFVCRTRADLARLGHDPVRIALLSSFTIDPLVPYVDLECRSLRLEPALYVAPFNAWDRETLGEGAGLQRFDAQIAFLAVAAEDLIPCLSTLPARELAAAGASAVDRLITAATRFTSWSPAVVVVHALHTVFRDPLGPAAGRDGPSRAEVMAELNARLAEGLRALPRAYLLDLPDVLGRRRGGALDNPKMRHLASMRLGESVLADLAAAYAQFIAPLTGRTRKCIVLDLDNTLWGGVVGEDGPQGIQLGNTSPGSEFVEFQEYLLSMTRKGLLLAINSKNNAADAMEVVRSHESMVLREESFSAMRINWQNKADNMVSLAEELSLGLDSLVFIDDSAKERALMRQALPQVLTPEMPRDPARYRETLESLPELHVLTVTDADRSRTRQYVERRERERLRVSAQTIDEYLRSLGIVAEMGTVSARTLSRVHQLFQRTNQFNLSGRRYDPGLLARRAIEDGWRVYTSSVSDRFGDHGLVAAALVQLEPDAWTIDNLVMSCRVIGYGVENALLARIGAEARDAGARWLVGEFVPSAKNSPARAFYPDNGFERDDGPGDAMRWRRDLMAGEMIAPRWIGLSAADGA